MEGIKELLQNKKVKKPKHAVHSIVEYYYELLGLSKYGRAFWQEQKSSKFNYSRNSRDAKLLLTICNNDVSKAITAMYNEYRRAKRLGYDWRISTAYKRVKHESTHTSIVSE